MQGVPPRNTIRIFPTIVIINDSYIVTLESRRVVVSDAALDPEYFEGVVTIDVMSQRNSIQLLFYQLTSFRWMYYLYPRVDENFF